MKSIFKNKHIQTLYPSILKKKTNLKYLVEEFRLNDGDFLEIFWYEKDLSKPVVVILHGLDGSYKSPYIPSLVKTLHQNGFCAVIMHFRGCGTKPNNKVRSYHSGDTKDLSEFLNSLHSKEIYAIGFSLGANVLLKYLGETKEASLIKKAIAVSTPFKLDICSNEINKGFSKFYQYILLKNLKKMLLYKQKRFNLNLSPKKIKKIKTFWEFDELYTAPIHGFKSAMDYYKKSSSYFYLKNITTPSLIIHAKDDPFMNQTVIPTKKDISSSITLEVYQNGGHVGFVSGSFFKPEFFIDKKAVEFLKRQKPLLN
jgi:predicted alpha/beta-fold hydrolase